LGTYKQEAKERALFTELRNLSDISPLQGALNEAGFVCADHLNYLIDLNRPPEAVLQSIGPRTRKKIRHALRQGEVVIEEADRYEQVVRCYKLLQKTYAAASVELIHKDRIYGWYGGMDRVYSDYLPNVLLLWHIFQWSAENGYKTYDSGGADKPDEEYGVRDFKAKFGGQRVCYGRDTCVHAPRMLALGKWAYAIYRRFL
jgi:serine/alanine adding enzyme